MSTAPAVDMAAVAVEYVALAHLLEGMPEARWDTPSLCEGWRVREVVAHVTMPVRYPPERFMAELADCGGDFGTLSNRIAARDASLPAAQLLEDLRDELLHAWLPPGGGALGALTHIVIHGLDITLPLDSPRDAPAATLRTVLDALGPDGGPSHFGIDLDGIRLEATDFEWQCGEGRTIAAPAGHLVALLGGRRLPTALAGDGPDHLPRA